MSSVIYGGGGGVVVVVVVVVGGVSVHEGTRLMGGHHGPIGPY